MKRFGKKELLFIFLVLMALIPGPILVAKAPREWVDAVFSTATIISFIISLITAAYYCMSLYRNYRRRKEKKENGDFQ